MYRSEIRPSQINMLEDKARKRNYDKYLCRVNLVKCRSFKEQPITFDFPVTALIGPNGGGKTTILGACALLYDTISPRQFFTRNRQLDKDMKNWSITYDILDRSKNKTETIRRTASFSKEKWYRDALKREVLFFGVSRTLPAVERKELSKYTNRHVTFSPNKFETLEAEAAKHIASVLGKDVRHFGVIRTDKTGNICLLSGETTDGTSYSEFHFGAGESSVIKMVIGIEKIQSQGLILIEEIENGLHPLAVSRLVDYLIDVAERKKVQVIFTTHSEYAIAPLPENAIWAALNGKAIQGKLDIHSLRSLTGEVTSQMIIYTEDKFAKMWVEAILRSENRIPLDAIEVYAMSGDSTAVNVNKFHNCDPTSKVKSICILDGDSRQEDDEQNYVYRLPGDAPEMYIFDQILDVKEKTANILAVRCMRNYDDADQVKQVITDISLTNRDRHVIFSKIGQELGFIDQNTIINAFLATWCEEYKDETQALYEKFFKHFLSKNKEYAEVES